MEGVTDLNQYILSQVFVAVKAVLADAKVRVQNLEDIFHPNGNYGKPFRGIQSSYQLLDHCKHNFNNGGKLHKHYNTSKFTVVLLYYRNLLKLCLVIQTNGKVTEKIGLTHQPKRP